MAAPTDPTMASGRPIALEATGVFKRYRPTGPWALNGANASIPGGSLVALVGPNGSGKSTLIRTWLGFERPNEGQVLVNGFDPAHQREKALECLGYVPQQTPVWRGLTVGDHITRATLLRPRFDPASAVSRLTGLGIELDRRATSLSGGERAQLILAVALGTSAQILMLDEPLASLDPLARHEFLRVLRDAVRSEGRTALLSSHIVGDLGLVCDRLLILVAGRIVLEGTVDEIVRGHRVIRGEGEDADRVGSFIGMDGATRSVVQTRAGPTLIEGASLEEIVMGYIAGTARRPVGTRRR